MTETLILTDILGNEIVAGDPVIYPQMSGQSLQMVLGTLRSYNGRTASIERGEGTRWSAGHQSRKYRDKRTGKRIDPYASDKHWESRAVHQYVHRKTGEAISEEELHLRHPIVDPFSLLLDRKNRDTWEGRAQYRQDYVPGVLKDYIEEFWPALRLVTIHNVKNIIKVVSSGA